MNTCICCREKGLFGGPDGWHPAQFLLKSCCPFKAVEIAVLVLPDCCPELQLSENDKAARQNIARAMTNI
jgi:hypothetical protein